MLCIALFRFHECEAGLNELQRIFKFCELDQPAVWDDWFMISVVTI